VASPEVDDALEASLEAEVFFFVSITSKPCEEVALSFALFFVCPNKDSSTLLVLDTTRYVERVIVGGWGEREGAGVRTASKREANMD
jgi:hypothetical protein